MIEGLIVGAIVLVMCVVSYSTDRIDKRRKDEGRK